MNRSRRTSFACAGIAIAFALAACGAPTGTTREATPTATPTPTPDITFDMKPEYLEGEPIVVAIKNNSRSTYYHQMAYPACYNLKFFDDTSEPRPYPHPTPQPDRLLLPGQFIVPEGTHCDLISESPVNPGARAVLFTWHQEMCTEDVWGCRARASLEPGHYRIEGTFANRPGVVSPVGQPDSDDVTTVEWTFVIVADPTPTP